MRVKCRCGNFTSVELHTQGELIETGNPKVIGWSNCDCGQEIKVYASIYFTRK